MPAIHYPFAAEVIDYDTGDGTTYPDWISGDLFTNPMTTLGRPTVVTTGDNWYIPLSEPVPLVAVYPAFRAFEMVMIPKNGSVTVAFDHPVYDNPHNPYGADFIMFGNSFQVIGGGAEWSNGDPNETGNGGSAFVERGQVFVSQDGMSWIEYADGPYADDFAPTLGRVYDTNNVQTNLGPWNLWWGGATDPTVPVDPAVVPSDWSGMSVAEISRRYRGSSGGTAFDLADLPLGVCSNTGWKWIRYVHVERSGAMNPEVDAVADVSPALPQDLWHDEYFAWMGDPDAEGDRADPDGDDMPNLLEYGLGRDPTNALYTPAFTMNLCSTTTPKRVQIDYAVATNAPDVDVEVVRTENLLAPDWRTNNVTWAPAGAISNGVLPMRAETPIDAEKAFMRLRVRHDE
jgi:hypothetical protein